jgi:hypothetical protein
LFDLRSFRLLVVVVACFCRCRCRGVVLSCAMTDLVDENYGKLSGPLGGREDWRPEVRYGERFWCFGVDGAARLREACWPVSTASPALVGTGV